jgi:hypothetical protein
MRNVTGALTDAGVFESASRLADVATAPEEEAEAVVSCSEFDLLPSLQATIENEAAKAIIYDKLFIIIGFLKIEAIMSGT